MEKQGIDAAWNAAFATAAAKGTGSTGGNAIVYTQLTGPKGKVYLMEEGDLKKLQMLSSGLSTASSAGLATDEIKWESWMASVEEEVMPAELKTSIDWDQYLEDNNSTTTPPLNQDAENALVALDDCSFFIDSRAQYIFPLANPTSLPYNLLHPRT
ncbi:hypothetical protein C0989_002033 [Termitomyces sp. Mn162]|nr:hypothetical protein C0989_002033 [Termitomyces sp. Mn162]